MSVSNQHKQYTAMLSRWKRCRDTSSGQDAVHDAGTAYLPQLSGQSASEYAAYRSRTPFYNATWGTICGLQAMLFRKAATVVVAPVVEPLLKDVSLEGEPLHMFAMEIVEEALIVGRVGIFVDYPEVDLESTTAADAKALNLRPTLKRYSAESIINWASTVVNNTKTLSMVVLSETVDVHASQFDISTQKQWRVLDLVDIAEEGKPSNLVYRVRVFIKNEKEEDVLISSFMPILKGQYLTSLPFSFIGVDSIDSEVDEPPLIDLVNINLSHYRTTADYEHGCHFTGLPTPVISGYTPDKVGESFSIGSTTAWVFPRTDAKAFFLEFTGQGLKALESNLSRKEAQMAVLGARMLEPKHAQPGNGAASINVGPEQSMLSSISHAVSLGLEKALNVFSQFAGSAVPVKYSLNKDFFPMPMSALNLTALVAGWQNGAYSYKTLFDNLQRGEVIDIDNTIEQELKNLELHKAPIPAGTKVNQDNTPRHETTLSNPTQRQLQTP